MTNEEALRIAYSKRKDSAGEERDFLNTIIQALVQTRWIPVSERLPKAFQPILVTSEAFHWANETVTYSVKQTNFGGIVDFIAWMPLPQPYSKEKEETLIEKLEWEARGLG